jgi:aspartokinase-like uncharacterized kinase
LRLFRQKRRSAHAPERRGVMSALIVKFGGSLLGSPALPALLAVAARHAAAIVPGGGPFADSVRLAQAAHGFSDRAAHQMAILAMEQSAHLLAELRPDLLPCRSPADFAAARAANRPALWMPAATASAADLPATWDVTSDSLALWLAIALGAERLVLLKSAAVEGGSPQDWAEAGLVDAHLPTLARRFAGEIACVGPAQADALESALAAGALAA